MKSKTTVVIVFINIIFTFLFFSNYVFAGSSLIDQFKAGQKTTGIATGHVDDSGKGIGIFEDKSIFEAIGMVIGVLLSLLGIFFLVLMIYAGYTWMVARGNEQEAEKAKSTIINAVIGLVIVLAAYAVTAFVSNILN